jgi:hypothetical protein
MEWPLPESGEEKPPNWAKAPLSQPKRNAVPHSTTLRVHHVQPKCRQVLERARQRRFHSQSERRQADGAIAFNGIPQ